MNPTQRSLSAQKGKVYRPKSTKQHQVSGPLPSTTKMVDDAWQNKQKLERQDPKAFLRPKTPKAPTAVQKSTTPEQDDREAKKDRNISRGLGAASSGLALATVASPFAAGKLARMGYRGNKLKNKIARPAARAANAFGTVDGTALGLTGALGLSAGSSHFRRKSINSEQKAKLKRAGIVKAATVRGELRDMSQAENKKIKRNNKITAGLIGGGALVGMSSVVPMLRATKQIGKLEKLGDTARKAKKAQSKVTGRQVAVRQPMGPRGEHPWIKAKNEAGKLQRSAVRNINAAVGTGAAGSAMVASSGIPDASSAKTRMAQEERQKIVRAPRQHGVERTDRYKAEIAENKAKRDAKKVSKADSSKFTREDKKKLDKKRAHNPALSGAAAGASLAALGANVGGTALRNAGQKRTFNEKTNDYEWKTREGASAKKMKYSRLGSKLQAKALPATFVAGGLGAAAALNGIQMSHLWNKKDKVYDKVKQESAVKKSAFERGEIAKYTYKNKHEEYTTKENKAGRKRRIGGAILGINGGLQAVSTPALAGSGRAAVVGNLLNAGAQIAGGGALVNSGRRARDEYVAGRKKAQRRAALQKSAYDYRTLQELDRRAARQRKKKRDAVGVAAAAGGATGAALFDDNFRTSAKGFKQGVKDIVDVGVSRSKRGKPVQVKGSLKALGQVARAHPAGALVAGGAALTAGAAGKAIYHTGKEGSINHAADVRRKRRAIGKAYDPYNPVESGRRDRERNKSGKTFRRIDPKTAPTKADKDSARRYNSALTRPGFAARDSLLNYVKNDIGTRRDRRLGRLEKHPVTKAYNPETRRSNRKQKEALGLATGAGAAGASAGFLGTRAGKDVKQGSRFIRNAFDESRAANGAFKVGRTPTANKLTEASRLDYARGKAKLKSGGKYSLAALGALGAAGVLGAGAGKAHKDSKKTNRRRAWSEPLTGVEKSILPFR